MKVAFRCDASIEIGTGHVMRCLTLADALRLHGSETRFLCRDEPGHSGGQIAARGHALTWLRTNDARADDALASRELLAEGAPWDWLVVDHYGLDAGWERELRPVARRIMVIDDLANRSHDCDLLLDQNLQASGRYAGLVPDECEILVGPKYALLRPQFAAARGQLCDRNGTVSRVLVFFGGTDAGGETLKALSAISMLGGCDFAVDVVIGRANPHRKAIEEACRTLPRTTLHCQVEEMAAHMAAADLFLGAGGTSSWERCCLGLPALIVAVADNQAAQSAALACAGAQIYLGPVKSVTTDRLAQQIGLVTALPELLGHMAERGKALVDGRGTQRVADHLLASRITLRLAVIGDSDSIFAWRNHPDTRRYAFEPGEIDRETHARWYAAALADPNRALLIAELDARAIGVLRFDFENGRVVVSLYLVPGRTGQGLGVQVLMAGEEWLKRERAGVQVCEAEIAAGNLASTVVFQKAGYSPYRCRYQKHIGDNG